MAVTRSRLDEDPGQPASDGSLVRNVLRRWPVVLIVLLLTIAAAAAAAADAPRTYQATAEVRVSSGNIPSPDGVSSGEANTLLATQVQYLLSSQLANDVGQRLDGEIEVLEMSVDGIPESQVATITVVADTPEGAAEAANTYAVAYDERRDRAVVEEATARAEQTSEQVGRLQEELAGLQAQIDEETERVNGEIARITIARDAAARVGTVLEPEDVIQPNTSFLNALQGQYSDTASQLGLASNRLDDYQQVAESGNGGVAIVSAATPPSASSSPGTVQVVALASILGLALGVGLALLLAVLDKRLRSAEDVANVVGDLPVVGPVVGRADTAAMDVDGMLLPPLVGRTVDSFLAPGAWVADTVAQSGRRALLVASPRGKVTTAGALAVAMARCGRRIVLVDADLRNHVPGYLDPTRRPGLSDVLLGDALVVDVLVDVEVPGPGSLRVISSGRSDVDLARLAHEDMGRVLEVLGRDADVVVVASAPVLHGSELELMPAGATASLLVTTLGSTRHPDVGAAMDHLVRAGAVVMGVVVADPKLRGTGDRGTSSPRQRSTGSPVATPTTASTTR